MRRLSPWKLAVVAVLAVGAAVTGVALAAGGHSGKAGAVPLPGVFASSHVRPDGDKGFSLRLRYLTDGDGIRVGVESSAAASYLGLSRDELMLQLRSGKTLAQIAGATSGKSVDGLVDALVAAAKTKLDAAVTAGKLTADQEQTILSKLRSGVTDLVNNVGPKIGPGVGPGPGHGFGVGADLSTAASYLGLSTDELMSQLRSGKTLAQIAQATSGKSVDGLVDALVAAAKTKLDAAVTAGKLTADQEQTILSKLRSGVTDLVNNVGGRTGRAEGRHAFRFRLR